MLPHVDTDNYYNVTLLIQKRQIAINEYKKYANVNLSEITISNSKMFNINCFIKLIMKHKDNRNISYLLINPLTKQVA